MPYSDPEKKKEYDRQYRRLHYEKHKEIARNYSQSHRESLRDKARKYRADNLDQCRARVRKWAKAYPWKNRAKSNKYRADILRRTPKWADLKEIQEFYRNCPAGYHVDHIVPLCGKTVSGLHVLENLQYLPANENIRKSNLYEEK